MHMHCHLKACILDYGPLHSFWLFAFERYNGILGSMPNNNHGIEIQLMKRFLRENVIFSQVFPDEFSEQFLPLFPKPLQALGSVGDTLAPHPGHDVSTSTIPEFEALPLPAHDISFPKHYTRHILAGARKTNLALLYKKLYVTAEDLELTSTSLQYASITVNGRQLGSHLSRSTSSSIIMAYWDKCFFAPFVSEPDDRFVIRAARIDFFCKHVVFVDCHRHVNILVFLSWYKMHSYSSQFGKPLSVYYDDLFEADGIHSLIPLQYIKCQSVSILDKLNGESVRFVSPCIDFHSNLW